jgi:phospholipase/carboxylesterase
MRLLHTAHVPPGDGPFPTVVALHGWGASGHDLLGLAPYFRGGEALVLCPQGEVEVPIGGGMSGYGWFPLRNGIVPDAGEVLTAAEALRTFLDQALAHYPVDRERVALLGFSQGGLMAYEQGLRHPERFAGVAALSTWLPPQLTAELPAQSAHERLPVLIVHGTQDTLVPVEKARESREALRPYGTPLTYREFPMAHEIRPEALQVIVRWLDERAWAKPLTG